ncbi:MAG: amidohydrolase family protein [Chloroflexi bacterium]|jgi:5-methylthioadenosine/S-adenosylhomocysteine deaminase|nr:amidohydrolase family protein [Anaerolineaceae bacterium]NLI43910.1 amidohydrolase family protein [Chloroflexota bacterium]HOE35561.1 amidohydrolase family protein [Anaerolineaceae bacterium]HOT24952.1 amidohydrolase family protein [Anaerolineaceae bacterium]HQK03071.1 amidohydrolase family protein [Anaerolineaceae bacterium]
MERAQKILTNAIVLTMDGDYNIYEPGAVAVGAQQILAAGPQDVILKQYEAEEVLDCGGKVLLPGFINAHTHVPMTLLRGLADDLRLDVWLMGYMMPVEREFVTPDFVRLGTKLACAEFIRSGITCFNDMYYFEDAVAEATNEAGLRAVVGQTVMKYPAPDASSYEIAISLCEDLIKKWKGHPLIIPAIAPHAVYTTTPEILTTLCDMAKKFDVPLHFHVSETLSEVENLRQEQGMPVIPYVRKFGMLETKLIAAHCVHVDEGEIRSMQHAGAGIAHNPSSNLKLASGFAPIQRMLELNANVGIGTDGTASNNDLDMIDEVRLASFVAKAVAGDPTALPARTALAMATCIGAKALHIDDITGSLEKGKRADLILLDISPLHNQPRFRRDSENIYAQIIYASKSTDITDVMVDGRWLMREHKLLTLNEEELIREAGVVAAEIDRFLKNREESVLSKLIAIGGAAEEESFEVQAKVRVEDLEPVLAALQAPEIQIVRTRNYHEFDTYFNFSDREQGRLRYREDEFIGKNGEITSVRSRLTLIGEPESAHLEESEKIMLSRSRYLAPAVHSLRFYNEYFKPVELVEIEKNRLRYLVKFRDTEFFINLDKVTKPKLGKFVEIKSRTWSRQDAQNKTVLMRELLATLGLSSLPLVTKDYIHLVEEL